MIIKQSHRTRDRRRLVVGDRDSERAQRRLTFGSRDCERVRRLANGKQRAARRTSSARRNRTGTVVQAGRRHIQHRRTTHVRVVVRVDVCLVSDEWC